MHCNCGHRLCEPATSCIATLLQYIGEELPTVFEGHYITLEPGVEVRRQAACESRLLVLLGVLHSATFDFFPDFCPNLPAAVAAGCAKRLLGLPPCDSNLFAGR